MLAGGCFLFQSASIQWPAIYSNVKTACVAGVEKEMPCQLLLHVVVVVVFEKVSGLRPMTAAASKTFNDGHAPSSTRQSIYSRHNHSWCNLDASCS